VGVANRRRTGHRRGCGIGRTGRSKAIKRPCAPCAVPGLQRCLLFWQGSIQVCSRGWLPRLPKPEAKAVGLREQSTLKGAGIRGCFSILCPRSRVLQHPAIFSDAYAWYNSSPVASGCPPAQTRGQGRRAERAKHPEGCWDSRARPRHENSEVFQNLGVLVVSLSRVVAALTQARGQSRRKRPIALATR
jgi:hypothetical protein